MTVAALDIYSSTTAIALPYYRQRLADDNIARFKYMSEAQKKQVRTRLASTLVLLRIDAEQHMQRQRKEKLKGCCKEIQTCCDALFALDNLNDEMLLDAGRDQPLGYMGLYAHLDLMNPKTDPSELKKMVAEAKAFAKLIQSLDDPMNDEIEKERQNIAMANDNRRLHWVAGTSMFQTFLKFLEKEKGFRFEHQGQLEGGMAAADWPMGFLGTFIYLYRLFWVELRDAYNQAKSKWQPVQTSLVSLPDEGAWQRFKADASGIRKYILLNDFFWGVVNLLGFTLLRGPDTNLAQIGAQLTLAFLVMDVVLTGLRFWELSKAFDHNLETLEKKITKTRHEIMTLKSQLIAESVTEEEQRKLNNQIHHLTFTLQDLGQVKKKLVFDWQYQKYQLCFELGYTVSLVAAFGMMTSFFVAGSVAGPFGLALAGAVVWFGMTLALQIATAGVEQAKIKASMAERKKEAERLIQIFDGLATDREWKTQSEEAKTRYRRDLYLEIKALVARNEYDENYAHFLRKKAWFKGVLHALSPVVIFCSMVMLPLVLTGVGVIGGAAVSLTVIAFYFAVLYVANRWMDTWAPTKYEPQFFPSFEKSNVLALEYERQFKALEEKVRQSGPGQLVLSDFEQPVSSPTVVLRSSPDEDPTDWAPEPVGS